MLNRFVCRLGLGILLAGCATEAPSPPPQVPDEVHAAPDVPEGGEDPVEPANPEAGFIGCGPEELGHAPPPTLPPDHGKITIRGRASLFDAEGSGVEPGVLPAGKYVVLTESGVSLEVELTSGDELTVKCSGIRMECSLV